MPERKSRVSVLQYTLKYPSQQKQMVCRFHSDKDQRFCDVVEAAINDPSLRAVFDALEINAADAWALFQQLDSVAQLQ